MEWSDIWMDEPTMQQNHVDLQDWRNCGWAMGVGHPNCMQGDRCEGFAGDNLYQILSYKWTTGMKKAVDMGKHVEPWKEVVLYKNDEGVAHEVCKVVLAPKP